MKHWGLLCCGLVASSHSVAATPPQELDPLVITNTREATPLSNLAGNTGLVTEEEIELIRPDHISELLNRIPGVYIHRNNGQENLVSIRSPILTGPASANTIQTHQTSTATMVTTLLTSALSNAPLNS